MKIFYLWLSLILALGALGNLIYTTYEAKVIPKYRLPIAYAEEITPIECPTYEVITPTPQDKIKSKIYNSFEDADTALAIAKAESGLNPFTKSGTDITKCGHPYSIGLFQINLTVTGIEGVNCTQAFKGRNNNAKIVNMELYNQCVRLAEDPDKNIRVAQAKYSGRGNWTAWGAYTNGAYKRFLNK